jgi:glycosyltransferase involved in cell wall biosynthesis
MAVLPDRPDVSVVIPAFKAAATIAKTVESCLDDPVVAEVIVVVDGPDRALEDAVPADERIRVIVNPSTAGAPAARNRGLDAARGEFVLFLDADDYVEGGLLGALAAVGNAERSDLIFGPFAFAFPSGRRIPVAVTSAIPATDTMTVLKAWFAGNYVPCCSVMWRTSFVRNIGGWNEKLLRNQDGELVVRACRHEPRIALAHAGRGIYVQSESGNRVTRNFSEPVFRQQIALLADLEHDMPPDKSRHFAPAFGAIYYRLARLAYFHGHAGIGDAAESAARRLGFSGHEGSLAHRLAAHVLGLGRKERLSAKLHSFRARKDA